MFSKQALRRLILPLIIEQFLAVMVGMADIMMVSSAGEAAVSSVALVDLINVLIINIFAALATGGAVVCARSIGAQNLERANRAANQLLYIVTAAALGIMVLVLFCKAGLLGLLFGQVEPEVMEGAVTYFVISALSYPFIAVYNGCAALLRAMGNSKASMCVSAYMNGQNIAGNAVFVFVFHQGVAGVALPSLLSRIAAAGLHPIRVTDQPPIDLQATLLMGQHIAAGTHRAGGFGPRLAVGIRACVLRGAADQRDPTASRIQQRPHRGAYGLHVRHRDPIGQSLRIVIAHNHQRIRLVQYRAIRDRRAHEENPAVRGQLLRLRDRLRQAAGAVVGIGDHRVPAGTCRRHDAVGEIGHERLAEIGDGQSDELRAAGFRGVRWHPGHAGASPGAYCRCCSAHSTPF